MHMSFLAMLYHAMLASLILLQAEKKKVQRVPLLLIMHMWLLVQYSALLQWESLSFMLINRQMLSNAEPVCWEKYIRYKLSAKCVFPGAGENLKAPWHPLFVKTMRPHFLAQPLCCCAFYIVCKKGCCFSAVALCEAMVVWHQYSEYVRLAG